MRTTRWPSLSAPFLHTPGDSTAAALKSRGLEVEAAPWNGSFTPFLGADLVVLRSNWDYHYALGAFTAWLESIERSTIRLFNPPGLVQWNLDKRYLLDLAARGVLVPKTHVVPRDAALVSALFTGTGWERAVLKPAVGASGHNVRLVDREAVIAAVEGLEPAGSTDQLLVQEFMAEVGSSGELACVFFNGAFSHAFYRQPAPGEFRVNSQYLGRVEPASPPVSVVRQASAVLDVLPEMPLYARVDGVLRDDRFVLMELELNEPGLGLQLDDQAADRFADATVKGLPGTFGTI